MGKSGHRQRDREPVYKRLDEYDEERICLLCDGAGCTLDEHCEQEECPRCEGTGVVYDKE